MSLHIIIDGYNLIRQSNMFCTYDHEDIQLGRDMLLDALAVYKRLRSHKITVVFDGSNAPFFSQQKDRVKGINIKFSRDRESADSVIKKMTAREREKALVVSSDRDVVKFAASQGSATISSQAFDKKLFSEVSDHDDRKEGADEGARKPYTKKKGPRKRLSKKERQNRIKIKKL